MDIFKWKCKTFGKWLNSLNEFCRQRHIGNFDPQWTPEMLYDFWKKIDNRKLPTSDRFEHEIIVDNRVVKDKLVPATRSESARRYKQLMEYTKNMTLASSRTVGMFPSTSSKKRSAVTNNDDEPTLETQACIQREKRRRAQPDPHSDSYDDIDDANQM